MAATRLVKKNVPMNIHTLARRTCTIPGSLRTMLLRSHHTLVAGSNKTSIGVIVPGENQARRKSLRAKTKKCRCRHFPSGDRSDKTQPLFGSSMTSSRNSCLDESFTAMMFNWE